MPGADHGAAHNTCRTGVKRVFKIITFLQLPAMRPLHMLFATSVALLWGCNFVAARFGTAFFPPFLLTAIRFTLVSLVLIPLVERPTFAQLKQIMVLSSMSTLHFSLIFVAIALGLDIASSALLGQLGVVFACIFGAVFLHDMLGMWRIGGIVIAFIGTAIVAGTPHIMEHPDAFWATVGSTLTWGIANVLIKRIQGLSSMAMLAWMGLCTVPQLVLLSLVFEPGWPVLADAPLSALLAVAYTAVCSTILAYGLWYYLLTRYNVSQVAPYSLMTPVFGIAGGQLFFTEELTAQVLLGGLVTIAGVAVIVLRRPKTIPLGEAT
jgi:O-acetylserine/cysteine efflux transporter